MKKVLVFALMALLVTSFTGLARAKALEDAALSYVQAEYRVVEDESTFSLRRVRIRFCGSLADGQYYWRVEPDLGDKYTLKLGKDTLKLDKYSLKFAYLDIKRFAPAFNIRLGKFAVPSGQEAYWTWPPKQLTVYISPVQRLIWEMGNIFAQGIQISGSLELAPGSKLTYILASLNSKGDFADEKDLAVRVNLVPVKDILIGFWNYNIRGDDSTGQVDDRRLSGIDFKYSGGNWDIRAEYDTGDAGKDGKKTPGGTLYGNLSGYYIMVGYTIPTPTLMQGIPALKVQPVVAYSVLDPDISGVDPCKVTTLGVNLYPDENLKIMLNYRMIDDPDGAYFESEDDVFEIRTQLLFK